MAKNNSFHDSTLRNEQLLCREHFRAEVAIEFLNIFKMLWRFVVEKLFGLGCRDSKKFSASNPIVPPPYKLSHFHSFLFSVPFWLKFLAKSQLQHQHPFGSRISPFLGDDLRGGWVTTRVLIYLLSNLMLGFYSSWKLTAFRESFKLHPYFLEKEN